MGEALKTELNLLFCKKKKLHIQGKSPFLKVSSSIFWEQKVDSKSQETYQEGRHGFKSA